MTHFDVFNGDADGLCALQQLRLADPVDSVLESGAKRDIALLERLGDARAGDTVTVLDVSLAVNRGALERLLARGVGVEWFDHHGAPELPSHPGLRLAIDSSPDVCTSMLVDRRLDGQYRIWAVVGAFGDNLSQPAAALAASIGIGTAQLRELEALGSALAYNAYGDSEADLIVHPVALYRILSRYADPFDFMRMEPIFARIRDSQRDDLGMARLEEPEVALAGATVYVLPDEPWGRRVRGTFANDLANRYPDLAHAVLSRSGPQGYTVSVRSPLAKGTGADELCRRFASGGGRARAAGINHLPAERLPDFVRELDRAFR
jgi:hypothetical protein